MVLKAEYGEYQKEKHSMGIDVGDKVAYSNGYTFAESYKKFYTVIKFNPLNEFILLQSQEDSSYKEINLMELVLDYKKV